jgi:hypothetical protein
VRGRDEDPTKDFTDYIDDRKFWPDFSPAFASGIHDGILDEALPNIPADALKAIKSLGFWVDVEVLSYDPRDHFDFAYVDESWAIVKRRLSSGDFEDLALALHAAGDFYAHTLYGSFATPRPDGSIPTYDPDKGIDPAPLIYNFNRFKPLPHCKHSIADAQNYWKGSIISGQWWRWYTTYPDELEDRKDFKRHFCLPDHDLLAVDGPKWPGSQHYISNKEDYENQFKVRRAAAVEHIAKLYAEWEARHGTPNVPSGVLGPQHK